MKTDEIEREERGIYLIMFLAGLPIIGALLIEQRAIDGGNTLMLAIVVLSVIGLAAGVRALLATKLPHARVLSDAERGPSPVRSDAERGPSPVSAERGPSPVRTSDRAADSQRPPR